VTVEEICTDPYLCLDCDNVDEIPSDLDLNDFCCDVCESGNLVYAIHIHGGHRKRWVKTENSGSWKRNKKLEKSLKNDLSLNKELTKKTEKITKQIFDFFNESDSEAYFPHYRVNFARTSKRTVRLKRRDNKKRTKQGSIRGELYEVFFLKAIDNIEHIERCNQSYEHSDRKNPAKPDAVISFDSVHSFPVEFKTVAKDNFLLNKIQKHLSQSHSQGIMFDKLNLSKDCISVLIVCCPEDRIYGTLLLDNRIRGRITHLKGRPSKKKMSRTRNRERQEKEIQERQNREREDKRKSRNSPQKDN
jgi:hypothetical protein